nr:MAG TPA: hypothetical protein [Herelleviridae sp.]
MEWWEFYHSIFCFLMSNWNFRFIFVYSFVKLNRKLC